MDANAIAKLRGLSDGDSVVILRGTEFTAIVDYCECAHAKIEDLQAVVKRLPHDAEGVPCLPGDERWAWTHRGTDKVLLRGYAFWESGGESGKHIGFGIRAHPVAINTGYSTEAAARAAGEEGKDNG